MPKSCCNDPDPRPDWQKCRGGTGKIGFSGNLAPRFSPDARKTSLGQRLLRSRDACWHIQVRKSHPIFDDHPCPGRPGSVLLRHTIAPLGAGCAAIPPLAGTPCSDVRFASPLVLCPRRAISLASRLPGTHRLRVTVTGGKRRIKAPNNRGQIPLGLWQQQLCSFLQIPT